MKIFKQQSLRSLIKCRNLHSGCIIGSGPSGMYLAHSLTKACENKNMPIKIDIYEKLSTPFGLVRYGVAPDHQDVKNVTTSFEKVLEKPNIDLIAGVDVGKDITLEELKKYYNFIVLCYGQFLPKYLNIEGENLKNIFTAKDFVGWYNGFPSSKPIKPNLSIRNVAVIGLGNVSIDVARILLSKHSDLYGYDIPNNVLHEMETSKVRNLNIYGRRNLLNSMFTVKELREFSKIDHINVKINSCDTAEVDKKEIPREKKRLFELMEKLVQNESKEKERNCAFNFNMVPLRFIGDEYGCVKSMEYYNKISKKSEIVSCELVVTCIGYQGCSIDPTIQFDANKNCIYNDNGRILSYTDKTPIDKLYCNGWLKTGPKGNIASTMVDSFNTCDVILSDMAEGKISSTEPTYEAQSHIYKILSDRNVYPVNYDHWKAINREEKLAGQKLNKIREKIIDPNKISEIIGENEQA